MSFNLVSTLLAVSSAHDTVHIFKLGSRDASLGGASPSAISNTTISSPSESVDGAIGGLEGGYEAYMEKKKVSGVG